MTTLFLFIIPALYLFVSFWLSRGLKQLRSPQIKTAPSLTFDIIIAARNEEKNLPLLFNSLSQLAYPTELYTITVVNDRSTDTTAKVLQSLQEQFSNLTVITVEKTPKGIAPKKHAVSMAVKATSNQIIVSTDADSIVKPDWLCTMASYFEGNEHMGLLQGITKYVNQPNISKPLMLFQRVDFISHCIIAAAGIGKNLPINSNANNFAYRRETYDSIKGFDSVQRIVSGDDDLLLQKIWKSNEWDLGFMIEEKATVITQAETTWGKMFNQRMRWGSKTVHYALGQKIVLGTIFLFYLTTLLAIPFSFTDWLPLFTAPILFGVKLLGELFFLIRGTQITKEQELLFHTIWSSPIQLFVVVLSVLMGVFGSFQWKSQEFQREIK